MASAESMPPLSAIVSAPQHPHSLAQPYAAAAAATTSTTLPSCSSSAVAAAALAPVSAPLSARSRPPPPPPPPLLPPSLSFHRSSSSQSLPPDHDLALDPTIRQLLDQQAEIQAKLAALLPQHYGLNIKLELAMLHHKLRVLRAYALDNHVSDWIPSLSEAEEARTLQFQCECVEAACLTQGAGLDDPRVREGLKLYFRDQAPEGFGVWLDRNLTQHDPVTRAWRPRDSVPAGLCDSHSHKCWDERCMHYIYGYSLPEERDHHAREHGILAPQKRDSAFSLGGGPGLITPPFFATPEQPSSASTLFHGNVDWTRQAPPYPSSRPRQPQQISPLNFSRPYGLPGSYQPGSSPVTALDQSQARARDRERRKSMSNFTLTPSTHTIARQQGSVESETDPLLPPLKRSRVGQSRLESIGELRLLRDTGPCLRCKMLEKPVSPCMCLPA